MGQASSLTCPEGPPTLDVMLKAAKDGDIERLTMYIKSHESIVNARNKRKNTPLHIACIHGRTDVAKVLLENGAVVNATCMHGYTPLYIAVMENHVELVAELIRHGANVMISPTKDCNALRVAEMQGQKDIARLLRNATSWQEQRAGPSSPVTDTTIEEIEEDEEDYM